MKADGFLGIDFKIKTVDIDGIRVKLQVLDAALHFNTLLCMIFTRGADNGYSRAGEVSRHNYLLLSRIACICARL